MNHNLKKFLGKIWNYFSPCIKRGYIYYKLKYYYEKIYNYRMSEDTKSKVKFKEWFEQFKKK